MLVNPSLWVAHVFDGFVMLANTFLVGGTALHMNHV